MDNVKDRMLLFLRHLGLGQSKFEKEVGLSNGYINNISKGIGAEKLQLILGKFPELNPDWLVSGEGEMLRSRVIKNGDNSTQIEGNKNQVNSNVVLLRAMEEIAEQRKLVAKSQEQIDRLIALLENK